MLCRIVRHCLAMFAEPSSPGADLHAFDENKVSAQSHGYESYMSLSYHIIMTTYKA